MGTGDKLLWGNLRWTSIPSRGSSDTSSWFRATETGISSSSVGQLGPSAALPYLTLPGEERQYESNMSCPRTQHNFQYYYYNLPLVIIIIITPARA